MKEIIRTLKPFVPEGTCATGGKGTPRCDRFARLSAANENPYGTSPLVREATLSYVTQYMMLTITQMVTLLSLAYEISFGYWKVQHEQLVIGVGLDEVNWCHGQENIDQRW